MDLLSGLFVERCDKMFDEEENVHLAILQPGEIYLYNIEPIVEIIPKLFQLNKLLEILIGGCNDSNVRLERFSPAEGFKFFAFKHSQELCLNSRGDIPDLVQKDGSLLGELKSPWFIACGVGKGTLAVPEEF